VSWSGRVRLFDTQDFDTGRRREYLAEGVHPIARLLGRADASVAELIELIEACQLDLELQRGSPRYARASKARASGR
jgi:hypothetical protein